jgi:hypothetical protein
MDICPPNTGKSYVDLTIATSIDTDAIDLILLLVADEESHYLQNNYSGRCS